MFEKLFSLVGLIHCAACLYLLFFLGSLARERGRSPAWGLLGPLFWSANALMFWSLSGADISAMGVIGGAAGAISAYVVVFALDSAETLAYLEAEAAKKKAQSDEEVAPLELPESDSEKAPEGEKKSEDSDNQSAPEESKEQADDKDSKDNKTEAKEAKAEDAKEESVDEKSDEKDKESESAPEGKDESSSKAEDKPEAESEDPSEPEKEKDASPAEAKS